MFGGIEKLTREINQLRRELVLIRKTLLRMGKIHSVDTAACTVVVEYAGEAVGGQPLRSLPMPWLQRSTEHRPPDVGDHALVLDPSLGKGAGLVIVGWPSTAKPPPDGAGAQHVVYAGNGPAKVIAPDIRLGQSPTDFAALAAKVLTELQSVKTDLDAVKATFDAHIHVTTATVGAGPAVGVLSPPATPIPPPHTPQSVAAEQVRVK